jgi:hypothetical protein
VSIVKRLASRQLGNGSQDLTHQVRRVPALGPDQAAASRTGQVPTIAPADAAEEPDALDDIAETPMVRSALALRVYAEDAEALVDEH